MRGKKREKTDIVVKVLDFSEFIKMSQEEYKNKHDIDAEIRIEKTGFIQVGEDKYMLNDEGIISSVPISTENTWDVNVFITIGNTTRFGGATVTPLDTESIAEEVNLADFVRSFGSRLESNYKGIVDFISSLKKEVNV